MMAKIARITILRLAEESPCVTISVNTLITNPMSSGMACVSCSGIVPSEGSCFPPPPSCALLAACLEIFFSVSFAIFSRRQPFFLGEKKYDIKRNLLVSQDIALNPRLSTSFFSVLFCGQRLFCCFLKLLLRSYGDSFCFARSNDLVLCNILIGSRSFFLFVFFLSLSPLLLSFFFLSSLSLVFYFI